MKKKKQKSNDNYYKRDYKNIKAIKDEFSINN